MKIIYKKVDELIPYINNPRKNDNAVDKVASSIKNFGFKVPIIIDSKGEIITGHTRLKACKKLKIDEVPCIIADDLTDEQIKAFRIADNRVAEESSWDNDLLSIELDGLDEFSGFDEKELFKILDNEETEEPEINFSEELLLEHNYVVLYFDNEVDWLQAKTLFDIKTVKGKNEKLKQKGVGRVLRGTEALKKILEG